MPSTQTEAVAEPLPLAMRLNGLTLPFRRYLRWWLRELAELLPLKIRRLFSERRLRVRASLTEMCVSDPYSSSSSNDHCRVLKPLSMPENELPMPTIRERCDLVLDSSVVLVREITLPMDAEENLRQVLAFSMDRYTPYTEEDVYFDYKVVRRVRKESQLFLRLFVAPKDHVVPIIQRLAREGFEPARMDAALEDSGRKQAGVNFLSAEQGGGANGIGRSNRWLLSSSLLLLLMAMLLPLAHLHQRAALLENEMERIGADVRQAEGERMELANRVEQMRQIQQKSALMPPLLDVLLELTRLIPDDAWARQVEIKSGRVRLSGEATAASELLTRLSNSVIFTDPRFEAPLTQDPKSGRERFVISLAIRDSRNDG